MTSLSPRSRALVTVLALFLVAACSDGSTAPGGDEATAKLQLRTNVTGTTVATIVVEVTAPDIDVPLVFNFTIENGVGAGTIELPAGPERTLTITAFDVHGIATHRGTVTIDVVEGTNSAVAVTLVSLVGEVSIEVTLGSLMIVVEPGEVEVVEMAVGEIIEFTATITDPEGAVVPGDVRWATSDPGVIRIDEAGVAVATGPGEARIVATFQGTAGAALVRVVSEDGPPVASVEVTPAAASVLEAHTLRLDVTLLDADGNQVFRPVAWSSDDPAIAEVSETGRVTGHLRGVTTIRATAEGVTGTAEITVLILFARVSTGDFHTCGLTQAGVTYCWGAGNDGRLGTGSVFNQLKPAPVADGPAFDAASAGGSHSCGVTSDGAAYCWGDGSFGQLGTGSTEDELTPATVAGALSFAAVRPGGFHTCGVTSDGAAYCWGSGLAGRLGTGSADDQLTPTAVAGGLTFASVSLGSAHSCGVTTPENLAYCWGAGGSGRLGTGSTDNQLTPTAVAGELSFASVGAGNFHSCGRTPEGVGYCWGQGSEGQLGTGSTDDQLTPAAVAGGLTFAAIDAGAAHNCGLTPDGAAYCWGWGNVGQLGTGSTANELTPAAVVGGLSFAEISAGGLHSCGVTTGGVAYCWGRGGHGQLGNGLTDNQLLPTKVSGQP